MPNVRLELKTLRIKSPMFYQLRHSGAPPPPGPNFLPIFSCHLLIILTSSHMSITFLPLYLYYYISLARNTCSIYIPPPMGAEVGSSFLMTSF